MTTNSGSASRRIRHRGEARETALSWAAVAATAGAVFAYGNFLTVLINFLILAWIIFLMVKAVNTMRKRMEKQKTAEAPAGPPADVVLLTEIRDLLAKR